MLELASCEIPEPIFDSANGGTEARDVQGDGVGKPDVRPVETQAS